MITATCINKDCAEDGIGYNVVGNPDPVQCGLCGENCELTDPRPDPEPTPFPDQP